jgi:NADPH-dependent 2,4-dienoyl-CoA reductase/sulfur reductase-like enzyme
MRYEVLVIGAGPAGLSAAVASAREGCRVGLLDAAPRLGGAIGPPTRRSGRYGKLWSEVARLRARGLLEIWPTAAVVFASADSLCFGVHRPGRLDLFEAERVVLATGARERFWPVPGWTLPGVFGVGGLQALCKGGWPISGIPVVLAGSGPLLWFVASDLSRRGARLELVLEQHSPLRWMSMLLQAGTWLRIRQALRLWKGLAPARLRWNSWPVEIQGDGQVEALRWVDARGRSGRIACRCVGLGYGLVPNTEVAELMELACSPDGFVSVDADMQTSHRGVYAAGELTGIGGMPKALLEGLIAGRKAAGAPVPIPWRMRNSLEKRFASRLAPLLAPRRELREHIRAEEIICRCEDVSWSALMPCEDGPTAKLQTRCGMGPCQGRVCGPILQMLRGWKLSTPRPPLFPVPAGLWSQWKGV